MTNQSTPAIEHHFDVKTVATQLSMSVRWVKERIKAGELQGYRLGHKIVVPEKSLQSFLENRAMAPRVVKPMIGAIA
jgi:excisionase family DNA binding protein